MPGGQVDADNVKPAIREHACGRTCATTDVGNDARAIHHLCEPAQHRAVERSVLQVVVEPFGILCGGEVVAFARTFQEAQIGHLRTLRALAGRERWARGSQVFRLSNWSGLGPVRPASPLSSADSASMSASLSSKSNSAKFSLIRCGVTDLGNTTSPR